MFKTLLLVCSFFAVTSAESNLRGATLSRILTENEEWKQFSHFQERFSKKYESLVELEYRFQVFVENLRKGIFHFVEEYYQML